MFIRATEEHHALDRHMASRVTNFALGYKYIPDRTVLKAAVSFLLLLYIFLILGDKSTKDKGACGREDL